MLVRTYSTETLVICAMSGIIGAKALAIPKATIVVFGDDPRVLTTPSVNVATVTQAPPGLREMAGGRLRPRDKEHGMLESGSGAKGETRGDRLARLLRDGSATRPGFPGRKPGTPNYVAAAAAINAAAAQARVAAAEAAALAVPDSETSAAHARPAVTAEYLRLLGKNQKTNPSADILSAVSEYFGVSSDYLIGSPAPPLDDEVRVVVVGENLSHAAQQAIDRFVRDIVDAEKRGLPLPQGLNTRTVPAES